MEALELSGGMQPETDEVTADTPTSPTYREGASFWLWDDAGRFGFPRVGVESVGATWATSRAIALCLTFPDGRRLVATADAPPHAVVDERGRRRVVGAGPLRFECLEPFARWRIGFDGDAADDDASFTSLRLDVDTVMVAPPWVQGTRDPEGYQVLGEHRFEQLCTVTGTIVVDGDETSFVGGGLRIHRKGGNRSDYGDFYGHNWQSARFPSGRAFGFIHYRPRPDGSVKYREGWMCDGNAILPARVEATPWMSGMQRAGEDVSFTLRTPNGDVSISGETVMSSIRPPRPIGDGTSFPTLYSGIARYRWDGEETFGMIERSARL